MLHTIKLNIDFADAIDSGKKTFEVRLNDRGYQRGDCVRFVTVDKASNHVAHRVERKTFEITYALNGWGIKADYIVFAIKKLTAAQVRRYGYKTIKFLKVLRQNERK